MQQIRYVTFYHRWSKQCLLLSFIQEHLNEEKEYEGPTAEEIRIAKEIKKGKTGYTAGRKDENSME